MSRSGSRRLESLSTLRAVFLWVPLWVLGIVIMVGLLFIDNTHMDGVQFVGTTALLIGASGLLLEIRQAHEN